MTSWAITMAGERSSTFDGLLKKDNGIIVVTPQRYYLFGMGSVTAEQLHLETKSLLDQLSGGPTTEETENTEFPP